MENATQALIIAGVVFIALTIIAIGVFLRSNLNSTADMYVRKLDEVELNKYNSNFNKYYNYSDLQRTISAQEIVTVVKVARETNYGTKVYIKFLNNKDYGTGYRESVGYLDYAYANYFDENLFLKNHLMHKKTDGTYNSFEFDHLGYNDEGMIDEIYFYEVDKK